MAEAGPLRFSRECGGVVEIPEAVAAVLDRFRQRDRCDREAGGILLGRLIEGSQNVVVDEATIPGKGDRRGPTFFRRARKPAQFRVDSAWKDSDGTRVYLGEWHSHPEAVPHPSLVDQNDWLRISREALFEHGFLLFAIVGIEEIGIWEVSKTSGSLVPLRRIE